MGFVLIILVALLCCILVKQQWRVSHQKRHTWDKDPFE